MDSKLAEKVVDVKFIDAEDIDAKQDCILLRIPVQTRTGGTADAIVRLDVVRYVHPQDGSDLLKILADDTPQPSTLQELRAKGWFK